MLYPVHLVRVRFELTMLVVINNIINKTKHKYLKTIPQWNVHKLNKAVEILFIMIFLYVLPIKWQIFFLFVL